MAATRAPARARHHPVVAPAPRPRGSATWPTSPPRASRSAPARPRSCSRRRGSSIRASSTAMADRAAARRSRRVAPARRAAARLVFTAHSVPVAMADGSPYAAQLEAAARAVAAAARPRALVTLAYQSRSGSPARSVARARRRRRRSARSPRRRARTWWSCPIGFVCDHVEVLYDLDVEARAVAAEPSGSASIARPPSTIIPRSSRMLADLVGARAARVKLVVVGGGDHRAGGGPPRGRAGARARAAARPDRCSRPRTGSAAPSRPSGATASSSRAGPDSFLSEKPWALALCQRLGIEDRLMRTDDRFRRTFVVWRGRAASAARRLPAPGADRASRRFVALGALLVAGQAPDGLRPRAAARRRAPTRASARSCAGGSAARRSSAWRSRLVAGIYTADPDELSLDAPRCRASSRWSGASAA